MNVVENVVRSVTAGSEGKGYISWSCETIAEAQRTDPDVGPVVETMSCEWKKPSANELK